MNLPFDIRKGSIVEYSGPIGQYNFVRVIDIETIDEEEQVFTLANPYEHGKTFVGYSKHVRPVFLRENHLQTLGFTFDTNSRRHTKDNIVISSFGYSEDTDPMKMTYVDLGFRVLPFGFPKVPTIDQVKNDTAEVFYLHILQNYCEDKGVNSLDFDLIK